MSKANQNYGMGPSSPNGMLTLLAICIGALILIGSCKLLAWAGDHTGEVIFGGLAIYWILGGLFGGGSVAGVIILCPTQMTDQPEHS